jgi:hypothetical protein
VFEGYLKTIRHKGDEDVRFDARILLVIDRTDGQIAFEFFEGLLDLGQLDVAQVAWMADSPSVHPGYRAESLPPAGGDTPHNNLQPFLILNFCIALQGVFPPRG